MWSKMFTKVAREVLKAPRSGGTRRPVTKSGSKWGNIHNFRQGWVQVGKNSQLSTGVGPSGETFTTSSRGGSKWGKIHISSRGGSKWGKIHNFRQGWVQVGKNSQSGPPSGEKITKWTTKWGKIHKVDQRGCQGTVGWWYLPSCDQVSKSINTG